MQTVEQYKVFQLDLTGTAEGNPYAEVELTATFTCETTPDVYTVRGFYRGEGRYAVRFLPTHAGTWSYVTASSDPALAGATGKVEVTPAGESNHGRVLRACDVRPHEAPFSTDDDFTFLYEDGTRYLPFGTTAYAWTNQETACQEKTLETLAKAPFNKVRMCIFPKFYDYNKHNPELYAFPGDIENGFDHTRFVEEFWENLDNRIAQLDELGIEADIILLHPYDKPEWGFSKMTAEEDCYYLSYAVRRLAAYKNVWWSMANEWDLMPWKSVQDWDRYARLVMDNDAFGHLRSIHNCREIFDHSHPWITHVSYQRCDLFRTAEEITELRAKYNKPVIVDECAYEGNINWGWGNITGEEMTRRFWEGMMRGGYLSHGETYVDRGPKIWWAHGGELYGTSPERIGFCRTYFEGLPEGLDTVPDERGILLGTFTWDVTCLADRRGAGDDDVLIYFGFFRPSYREFDLPEGTEYTIDVVDTWDMAITTLPGTYTGHVRVDLPSKQYMLVRLTKVAK